jgi:catechol 2,3-dioxygenase-like lactoylglutathione lyase family enzyme
MTSAPSSGTLIAILPCNDLDASERFYNRLGFERRVEAGYPDYRILSNGTGGHLHLTSAEKGWLVPGRNPFGLYLYLEDVDGLAAALQDLRSGRRGPEDKCGCWRCKASGRLRSSNDNGPPADQAGGTP